MTNEITRPATTGMTMPPQRNVFEAYADAVNQNRIIGLLLKFSKGEWLSGRDNTEIAEGTQLVAGCDGLLIGWIHWHDNKPTDYQMGRVAEGFVPPKRSELGDFDQMDWERDEQSGQMRDPWQLSNSMLLMDAATRQLYTFATASKGGIGAVAKLLAIYGKHVRQVPDALPVVALLSDSYRHPNKAYGKIFTPLFKVTDWVHRGEFDAVLEEDSGAAIEASEAEEEEEEQAAILPAEKASPSPKVAVKAPVKEAGKAPLKGASKQRKAGQDNISF